METEKENETEREGGRKNARERKTEGGGGKDTEKLTQQKDKKNGKGPDALDWFLHDQSLTGGDGEARSLL